MPHEKKIKELMTPLTDYPHIPYWFTIKQAVAIAKKAALEIEGKSEPATLLIFDEKYHLLGSLTLEELIRGLQKKFFLSTGSVSQEEDAPFLREGLFTKSIREEAQKPVSEIMSPVIESVTPDDSLIKAIGIMSEKNLALLPVIENDVLMGIIRLPEIFNELAEVVMAEQTPSRFSPATKIGFPS
jgi:CBS-domain-containing membrane protein